jgi:hypothetical protein
MDAAGFDRLSRTFATASRRQAVKTLSAGTIGALVGALHSNGAAAGQAERCKGGEEKCDDACCAGAEECVKNLGRDKRRRRRVCCRPKFIFVDIADNEACCPVGDVCEQLRLPGRCFLLPEGEGLRNRVWRGSLQWRLLRSRRVLCLRHMSSGQSYLRR